MTETIFIQDIGEVLINYSQSATRLRISVKPFEGVVITVPVFAKKDQALAFLELKKDWIRKALIKTEKVENRNTIFDETTDFKTRSHSLKIVRHASKNISISVSTGIILVRCPENMNIREEQVQQVARRAIEFALRNEAKSYLPERVAELARQNGLKFKSLAVRASKSRWGSCSSSNSLNFSLHLMRLPDRLIDYVILHELAHTVVKNHSPKFWAFLDTICADSKKLDKDLTNYSTVYY